MDVKRLAQRGKHSSVWPPRNKEHFKEKKRRPVSRVLFCILSLILDGCHHPPHAAYPL